MCVAHQLFCECVRSEKQGGRTHADACKDRDDAGHLEGLSVGAYWATELVIGLEREWAGRRTSPTRVSHDSLS